MRGRLPKPTRFKVIAGTAQPCRTNPDEPAATPGRPDPPTDLSPRAVELYDETCATLFSMGLLALEWRDLIADYARVREEIELLSRNIDDLGFSFSVVNRDGATIIRANPAVAQRSDALKRAHALRAEMGLGPASKSRVSASKKEDENPFTALMRESPSRPPGRR